MRKARLLVALGAFVFSIPLLAQGPHLEQAGIDDLGGGNYRYHYIVNHADDPYINEEITDVHVEGQYQWQPGTVTVEGPTGWDGEYDGVFYHWRMSDTGQPIVHGSIEAGFSVDLITVGHENILVDSPVHWTTDPHDDQSIFATTSAPFPVPGPRLDLTGVEDLGGGDYRYNYVVDHSDVDHAIRGEVARLGDAGDGDLGPVTCLAWYLSNYDFTLNTDSWTPPAGQAYFYLYRFCGGTPTCSYGWTSGDSERIPSSGDCP